MSSLRLLSLCAVAASVALRAHGQSHSGFLPRYEAQVRATLAEQPHWATVLIATSPRLEQGFRTDFTHQSIPGGTSVWNYGASRGLQLIPSRRIELRFSTPPFLAHSGKASDGFGDVSMLFKYRFFARNEEHGNSILSAFVSSTVPTGKNGNGSCCATIAPTLSAGKGYGRFVLTTGLGGTLPVSNTKGLGRQIAWNSGVELRATRFVWLQAESNVTFYRGGKNDGKTQLFATPGIIVSRIPLRRGSPSALGGLLLTLVAGEQIALTRQPAYNHAFILSSRLRF